MYGQAAGAQTLTGNIFRSLGGPATATQINDATLGVTGFVVGTIKGSLSGSERYILQFATPALAQAAVDNRWSLLTIDGTTLGMPSGQFYVTAVRTSTTGEPARVVAPRVVAAPVEETVEPRAITGAPAFETVTPVPRKTLQSNQVPSARITSATTPATTAPQGVEYRTEAVAAALAGAPKPLLLIGLGLGLIALIRSFDKG